MQFKLKTRVMDASRKGKLSLRFMAWLEGHPHNTSIVVMHDASASLALLHEAQNIARSVKSCPHNFSKNDTQLATIFLEHSPIDELPLKGNGASFRVRGQKSYRAGADSEFRLLRGEGIPDPEDFLLLPQCDTKMVYTLTNIDIENKSKTDEMPLSVQFLMEDSVHHENKQKHYRQKQRTDTRWLLAPMHLLEGHALALTVVAYVLVNHNKARNTNKKSLLSPKRPHPFFAECQHVLANKRPPGGTASDKLAKALVGGVELSYNSSYNNYSLSIRLRDKWCPTRGERHKSNNVSVFVSNIVSINGVKTKSTQRTNFDFLTEPKLANKKRKIEPHRALFEVKESNMSIGCYDDDCVRKRAAARQQQQSSPRAGGGAQANTKLKPPAAVATALKKLLALMMDA